MATTGHYAKLHKGYELPPLRKEISLEAATKFAPPGPNFHNDPQAASKWGFPRPVAMGLMSHDYLAELVGSVLGTGWINGGELSVAFIKPVFVGDIITARGRVTDVVKLGDGTAIVTFDLWCENDAGQMTTVGKASGSTRVEGK